MTIWAVALAFVAALDPFRRRGALSVTRRADVVAGAALAGAGYVVLAALGTTVRDALDVSAPNARLAAGLVLLAVGLHSTVAALPAFAPADAPRAWLVPVCFPVLLRPDLALVAFAADGAPAIGVVAVAAAVGLGATVAWWQTHGRPVGPRVERGLAHVLGVVLVVAAVRLVLDGLFAV